MWVMPRACKGSKNLGHDVMQESVSLRGVKIQDAVECGGGEMFPNEHDKRLRNALFAKKPLAENRKDVLDSRPGNFAEHVLAAKPVDIHLR